MKSSVILFLTLTLTSCQFDNFNTTPESESFTPEEENFVPYIDVDEDLWVYFENFEKEAAQRNIDIDLNALGITGVISEINDDHVAGTCRYGSHIAHVTIDQSFWNNSSDRYREFVIFHELGHCVLGRDHLESAFSNGICRSIMRSGLGDCRDAYIEANRVYYLDELFEGNGPLL